MDVPPLWRASGAGTAARPPGRRTARRNTAGRSGGSAARRSCGSSAARLGESYRMPVIKKPERTKNRSTPFARHADSRANSRSKAVAGTITVWWNTMTASDRQPAQAVEGGDSSGGSRLVDTSLVHRADSVIVLFRRLRPRRRPDSCGRTGRRRRRGRPRRGGGVALRHRPAGPGCGQGGGVAGRTTEGGDAVLEQLGRAASSHRHHRPAAGHPLDDHPPERLGLRAGMDDDVERPSASAGSAT